MAELGGGGYIAPMFVSGQRDAPAALYTRESSAGTHYKAAGWASEPVWAQGLEGDRTRVIQSVVKTLYYPSYSQMNDKEDWWRKRDLHRSLYDISKFWLHFNYKLAHVYSDVCSEIINIKLRQITIILNVKQYEGREDALHYRRNMYLM
jgi:hypothetical protein